MTDKVSTESVEDLFYATRALLIAMKEGDAPETLARYTEGVEDALEKIEEQTGWVAEMEAKIDRQFAAAQVGRHPKGGDANAASGAEGD